MGAEAAKPFCCGWTSVGGHEPDCLLTRPANGFAHGPKPTGFDPVHRPEHYNSHPSGVECVEITEHMTCMIGCAIKYLWRHGQKAGADADQDLQKAIWCIERERQRLKKATNGK